MDDLDDLNQPVDLEALGIDYDINEARQTYIDRKLSEGKVIIYPKVNELQIDIDSEEDWARYQKGIACIDRNHVFDYVVDIKPSDSGLPNRHITITLPFSLTPWQRIAFQASLGSDPMRELLSSIRQLRGDIQPTLFVENPPQFDVFEHGV